MDLVALLAGFYVGTSVAGFATMYLVKAPLQRKLDELSSQIAELKQPLNENTKGEITTNTALPTCKA